MMEPFNWNCLFKTRGGLEIIDAFLTAPIRWNRFEARACATAKVISATIWTSHKCAKTKPVTNRCHAGFPVWAVAAITHKSTSSVPGLQFALSGRKQTEVEFDKHSLKNVSMNINNDVKMFFFKVLAKSENHTNVEDILGSPSPQTP